MTSSGKNPKIKDFTKVYDNLLTEFKREQTGYVFIAVIMQSCIGAVAAMVLLLDGPTLTNLTLLFVVTMLCMAYNGAVLAQLKSKLTFNLLILSIVFSCAVIVAYLRDRALRVRPMVMSGTQKQPHKTTHNHKEAT